MTKRISKLFSILLALCMIVSMVPVAAFAADVPSKLYLKPNSNWTQANARFAAYYFNDSTGSNTWVDAIALENGLYEVSVPAGYPNVIFCRMNGSTSANNWNNRWNQTSNLTVPTNGTNCYTIKDGTWDKGGGSWSTYAPAPVETEPVVTEPAVVDYYLVGYINGADYGCNDDYQNLGEYKFVDGKLTATFTADSYVFVKTGDNAHWYLAEAYCEDTTVTLKENCAEKLFVPANVEIDFTLVVNADGTLNLSYEAAVVPTEPTACDHSYGEGEVTTAPQCLIEGVRTYTCSKCGDVKTEAISATGHDYELTVVAPTCENNGYTIHACKNCTYSYNDTPVNPIGHDYVSVVTDPTCTEKGFTTYTCNNCGNVYTWNETPATGHNFVGGACSNCGAAEEGYAPEYYLVGYINGADYGCNDDYQTLGEYKFVDGKLTATFTADSYVFVKTGDNAHWYLAEVYCEDTTVTLKENSSEKLFVPANVELNFTLVVNEDGTLTLSYTKVEVEVPTEPTEPSEPAECEHDYVGGVCTKCGEPDPNYVYVKYYLFGYINGTDYGQGYDAESTGFFRLRPTGEANTYANTFNFTETSYIAVKTGDNSKWYMTKGYQGEVTSATLYDTTTLDESADKLMIPGGWKTKITLTDNGDGTFTLSYEQLESLTPAVCEHPSHDQNGYCTVCHEVMEHTYVDGVCTVCGKTDSTVPSEPSEPTATGYVQVTDVADVTAGGQFVIVVNVDGAYKALGTTMTKNKLAAVNVTVENGVVVGENLPVWTIEGTAAGIALSNANGYLKYSTSTNFVYDSASYDWSIAAGENGFGITSVAASTRGILYRVSADQFGAYALSNLGKADYTADLLLFKYSEITEEPEVPTEPTEPTEPSEPVEPETPDFYLVGYINGADYGCNDDYQNLGEYKFVDGKLTATFTENSYVFVKTGDNAHWYLAEAYCEDTTVTLKENSAEKLFVPANVELNFTLVVNEDGTLTLSYTKVEVEVPTEPTEPSEPTEPTEPTEPSEPTEPTEPTEPSEPVEQDYYLFGYINGANYGCEDDYENLGEYKFVDGKLTTTFAETSYVAVKTGDNATWYMTDGWAGSVTSVTLYDSKITGETSDKLMIPGGVKVTLTLTVNADGTLTLSYTTASVEPSIVPTLKGSGFTLSFEDEILVNFYYTVSDTTDVAEQGMLVFYTDPGTADYNKAKDVYSGSNYVAASGAYINTTNGIAAKEMGDDRYYCAYAKLNDGTYAYSPLYQYSPKKYATNMLGRDSTTAKQKALCVAMLNYGAAAQVFFNYRTDALMNAGLTAEQKALVTAYDASYFKGAIAADANKIGSFAATSGFSAKSASVSFEGAFAINYYFAPSAAVKGDMKLYIWTPEQYASVSELATDNASKVVTMEKQADGSYWGQVDGIAAKALDDTYYVAGVYTDAQGNTYCTGVIAYSLSKYCMNNAKPGKEMQALAAATAMYGYYADVFFS